MKTTHDFPKGSYCKDEDGNFVKILGAQENMRDFSCCWKIGEADLNPNRGLKRRERCDDRFSLKEMNAYFTISTALEAGVKEEWKPERDPERDQEYWHLGDGGCIYPAVWRDIKQDYFRLKSGNCFQTREAAEARYKEIMGE